MVSSKDLGSSRVDGRHRAEALVLRVRALGDPGLRVAYLVDLLAREKASALAPALDAWCARAEQAEEAPREALVALVDALASEAAQPMLQALREEAAGEALLALDRLLRSPPSGSRRGSLHPADPNGAKVPDYGKGRPLTLGERKAMARGQNRGMLERLLLDPHPDVIRKLLVNPRLTEDDVLRLATKRPCRPDVLAEVARSPRWMHRPRVRRALILNPDTPGEIAAGLVSLLVRQELKYVAEATNVSSVIRALCHEYLERRPPGAAEGEADGDLQ